MDAHPGQTRGNRSLAVALLIAALMLPMTVAGQDFSDENVEEIVVNFRVPKLINQDIFVLYDGSTIYLPLTRVFELLGIHVDADFEARRFQGDFVTQDNPYFLDLNADRASCHGSESALPQAVYILSETEVYLRVDQFPVIFQLPMVFTFSDLSVYLRPDRDFPAYQKLQRRMAHEQLRKDQTAEKYVRRLPRTRDALKGAAVDWQLSSSASGSRRLHNVGLSAGAMVLGGDLSLSGTANSETGVDSEELSYLWHYHVSDRSGITQVDLGHLFTTGPYSRALVGGLITNKPVVQRRVHQTIQVSDYVGEGWEVELYVNGQLIDFAYTGSDGRYDFLVDITYGSSRVELKMYGPNGEIRTDEDFVQVPFNLVPKGVFEYTVAGGQGQRTESDRWFVQGSSYYGILSNVTAGLTSEFEPGAHEDSAQASYTADITYQPVGSIIVNTSYSPDYLVSGNANYRKLGWVSANASFTKYFENELRNPGNREYSALLSASVPLRIKNRSLAIRLHSLMNKFPTRTQWNVNYGLSTTIAQMHLNYLGRWDYRKSPSRSEGDLSSRLFATFHGWQWLLPQVQLEYNHSEQRFKRYGVALTKRVFRTGRLALSYERDPVSKTNQIMLTFNLYNAFATFSSRVTKTDREVTFNQSQRGSILYDQEAGNVLFDRRNAVGMGSAVIRPFLDDNYNGLYDEGEEYLAGLRANIRGAGRRVHGEERLYYYDRLRPYDEYLIEIDEVSLDNPLLKPTAEHYSVVVNPNVVTSVEVPLVMGGEVSGYVRRERAIDTVGVGGVRIALFNITTESLTEVSTFAGGEYYYLGIMPGTYRAYVESEQLEGTRYRVEPEYIEFEIDPLNGLDLVEDLDFMLIANVSDASQ